MIDPAPLKVPKDFDHQISRFITTSHDSLAANESQRLLAQHRLRWQQEFVKQKEQYARDKKELETIKARQEWIHEHRTRRLRRKVVDYTYDNALDIAQCCWIRTRMVQLQRDQEPREEDSFDHVDPCTLPPRHQNWRWQPRTPDQPAVHPPGRRFSIRDIPSTCLQFKPVHTTWIQESLRMRTDLLALMFKYRPLNEYTAYDVGNHVFAVML